MSEHLERASAVKAGVFLYAQKAGETAWRQRK